jgi:hypothetical protein
MNSVASPGSAAPEAVATMSQDLFHMGRVTAQKDFVDFFARGVPRTSALACRPDEISDEDHR